MRAALLSPTLAVALVLAGPVLAGPVPAGPVLAAPGADGTTTTVNVAGQSAGATAGAPTTVPLDITQPTSILGRQAIEQYVAPTGNYDDALRLTPSVIDISPNGPGLGEAANVVIRGFSDGQYDVTFDGIPFADSDDFTHHSAAYFMAHDLAQVAVDRGPGDAATIGDATFGGTVSLASIEPSTHLSVTPYATAGTLATLLGGLELDTGTLAGGARALIDIEGENSKGALDAVQQRRGNLFAKLIVPLGPRTTLTVASNLSRTAENDSPGATRSEIARFGPSYALTRDTDSQSFEGGNNSSYRTDISYADLTTILPDGGSLSDKLYTYGLDRHFSFGLDPNGETPNGTALNPTDIPGQDAKNGLRAWGDILALDRPLGAGLTAQTGLWIERQTNARSLDEVDFSAGNLPNPILPPVPGIPGSAAIERAQTETLVTFQPYLQLAWQTGPLHLTAGLKGALFDRAIDAPVMEGTRLPTQISRTVGAPLPSISANLRLAPTWSVYAQIARGFLAPPLQFFDVSNPATAPIRPEQTWNFQAGTVWRTPTRSIAFDAYEILFENAVGSRTVAGQTIDFDEGSATYRGLEAELTQRLVAALSLYASGSLNAGDQHGTNGVASGPVPSTPQATLLAGLLYRHGHLDASLLDRWTGASYGDLGATQWIDPTNELDLSLGTTLRPTPGASPLHLQAQLFNLLDSRKIDGLAGYTAADATPLFWSQPGRSFFLSAQATF